MSENYYVKQLEQLVGGIVADVVWDEEEEDGVFGVETYFGLEIVMPDGKRMIVWFYQDDEGNGPGSFEIQEAGWVASP